MRFILSLFVAALFFTSNLVHAQTAETPNPEPSAQPETTQEEESPVQAQEDALQDRMSTLLQNLSQDEAGHFMILYTNYNVYSMVNAVQADLNQAVQGCIENNKDMEQELVTRYDRWKENVGTTLTEAKGNIDNMKLAQSYLSQAEVDKTFNLVDEVRAHNSSRFETIPVTTPEACEFMLSKMDETEDSMKQLLQVTLVSYPNLLKKNQR